MRTTAALIAVSSMLAAGCQEPPPIYGIPNDAPIAVAAIYTGESVDVAGAQFLAYTISGAVATLDASLSRDPDGTVVGWTWTLESSPEGSERVSEDILLPEDDPDTMRDRLAA